MIKGCNIFGGQKLENTCSFVGGRIIVQQEITSRAERTSTNPVNSHQEANHYSLIKFCIYSFSLWYKFFVHYALRDEKIINMVLMQDLWNYSFFSQEDVSSTHSELCCFVFGVMGKTPGLISNNNFVKKFLSALAIAIMSWQDVTRSSLCSGV